MLETLANQGIVISELPKSCLWSQFERLNSVLNKVCQADMGGICEVGMARLDLPSLH